MQPQQLDLRDIHLPDAIGWWPPAIGWWILVITIPLLCWLLVWFYQWITRKTALKTAKKLLLKIKQDNELTDVDRLMQLSALIRRVAMSSASRKQAASLTGQAWLEYLDSSVKGTPFSQGAGKYFANTQYQKTLPSHLNIADIIKLSEQWLLAQKNNKQ